MKKMFLTATGEKLPPVACPTCNYLMDAATPVDGEGRPRIGDLSLCAHCGEILVFNASMTLEVVPLKILMELPPETNRLLERTQRMIREKRPGRP